MSESSTTPASTAPVTVYWRPGCLFSSSLMRALRREGVAFDDADIWDDPDAAAFVRSVADGNETVPTVRLNGVALVNPTVRQVLRVAAEHAPDALPDEVDVEALRRGPVARLLARWFGEAAAGGRPSAPGG